MLIYEDGIRNFFSFPHYPNTYCSETIKTIYYTSKLTMLLWYRVWILLDWYWHGQIAVLQRRPFECVSLGPRKWRHGQVKEKWPWGQLP